ncbi:MAG: hypothetical protein AB7G93_11110 [Bdellovibrionales bacterium]
MQSPFLELKTTEGQTLYVRREAVSAFEVAPASARVEGHIKLFVGGFKFLVQIETKELLEKLKGQGK